MRITISLIFVLVLAGAMPAAADGVREQGEAGEGEATPESEPSEAPEPLQVTLEAPAGGAALTATTIEVVVRAEHATGDEAVDVRALAGGEPLGTRRLEGAPQGDGEGTWRWHASLDTSGWPNGAVTLEARALPAGQGDGCEDCPWVGHGVVLAVPPPAPEISASVEGDTVTVTWSPVAIPDASGYVVERAAGGTTEVIASVEPSDGPMSVADGGLDPGAYTFAVRAERPDGEGGVLTSEAGTAGATVEEEPEQPGDGGGEDGEGDGGETEEPEEPAETEEPEEPGETEEPEEPGETEEPQAPRTPSDSSGVDEQPVRRPALEPLDRTGRPAPQPTGEAGTGDGGLGDGGTGGGSGGTGIGGGSSGSGGGTSRPPAFSRAPGLGERPVAGGSELEEFEWDPPAPEVAAPESDRAGDERDGFPAPEVAPPEPRELDREAAAATLDGDRALAGDRLATAPGSVDVALLLWAGLLAVAHHRLVGRRRTSRA